jgi:hypothetical protein
LFDPILNFLTISASLADPCQVALYVSQENGDATVGKMFGERLESDCFARSGGTGDKAMAIGHAGKQGDFGGSFGESDRGDGH